MNDLTCDYISRGREGLEDIKLEKKDWRDGMEREMFAMAYTILS